MGPKRFMVCAKLRIQCDPLRAMVSLDRKCVRTAAVRVKQHETRLESFQQNAYLHRMNRPIRRTENTNHSMNKRP